jgi:hypothetical protein
MANRWFIDTEFNEDGRTIELISIALVSEAGEEYHAVSSQFDPDACNDWVKANVLPNLPSEPRNTRKTIAGDIRKLVLRDGKPEFWGYFCDYDWVVLCQLFGRMVDLPDGFPCFCLDLKQEMHRQGVKKERLPAQTGTEHDALEDAKWIREAWLFLQRPATVKP